MNITQARTGFNLLQIALFDSNFELFRMVIDKVPHPNFYDRSLYKPLTTTKEMIGRRDILDFLKSTGLITYKDFKKNGGGLVTNWPISRYFALSYMNRNFGSPMY